MLLKKTMFLAAIVVLAAINLEAQTKHFKVLALYENGGHHIEFSKRAKVTTGLCALRLDG
jgi:hypothetical protein